MSTEAVVSELEGRVREGEERRGEEVERAEEVISQLREQLKTTEKQRKGQEEEVSLTALGRGHTHQDYLKLAAKINGDIIHWLLL